MKQDGEAARFHATMRADELLGTGDLDGQRVWLRILKAVEELARERKAKTDEPPARPSSPYSRLLPSPMAAG